MKTYFTSELGIRGLKCFSEPLQVGKGGFTLESQVSDEDYFRLAFLPRGALG